MKLFHSRGYTSVGINDVLEATGIPKGSFYYYFSSKEDLIRQSILYYINEVITWTNTYSADIEGMRAFFRNQFDILESSDYRDGCPVGNMTSEITVNDDEVREELKMVERYVHDYVKRSLLNSFYFSDARAGEYATFIIFSFHGSVMKSKLERNSDALRLFDRFIFEMLLRREKTEGGKREKGDQARGMADLVGLNR